MKRNKFSLSHYKLLSCDMGELVPIGCLEVLPGDTVQHATSALLRCSPLLAPVMHPVQVRIHHFFVPHRLTWENWENFITGGPDGEDDSVFPTIELSYSAGSPDTGSGIVGGLADYLGCPTRVDGLEVSALPFRAYALVFNEWYRDQDLVNPVGFSTADGLDTTTNTALLRAAWEKDYFTSARPWEQKGPSITLPIGDRAPVVGVGFTGTYYSGGALSNVLARDSDGSDMTYPTAFIPGYSVINPVGGMVVKSTSSSDTDAHPDVYADLTQAAAVSITALREAFALQRYQEARARYGSRYTEYLRYLGVSSSDARLQRPEYLGGGKQTIQFSEVLQTAEGTDPVGEMRGHGISAMRTNRYRRFFEEHGYVITLLSVKPKTIYTQGVPRTYNRRTKEDFWQKELEHIGQQEVLNKEVYAAGDANDDEVFGYQDRYDEYRRQESTVSGEFRTAELDHWHFARQFSNRPALNQSFVEAVPTEAPFAVPSRDVLYVMANHSIQARRMLSRTGKSFIL